MVQTESDTEIGLADAREKTVVFKIVVFVDHADLSNQLAHNRICNQLLLEQIEVVNLGLVLLLLEF